MFYCNPCAEKNNWPETMFKSYGRCEVCKKSAVCNERPSKDLPIPRLKLAPKRIEQILQFERDWWKFSGVKDAAIESRLKISPERYYSELYALLDEPESDKYDARLVNRLRMIRKFRERRKAKAVEAREADS